MALPFFENGIDSGAISASPNNEYRNMLQAYVNEQWDNTTALENLKEQSEIGSNDYVPVEAMIAGLIDLTSTGKKAGEDFMRVFFRDFNHETIRGRYYQFADNYWIVDDISLYEGVAPLIVLRKCNNGLRMIDPSTGDVFIAPCVVNYDMTSPMVQISRYVITPNNHAEVIVQANSDTMRLFKLNTRFILGGRPFKLYSFQNTLLDDLNNQVPTIMYLDLYLDEIHSGDDLENRIADNGFSDSIEKENELFVEDGVYIIPDITIIKQYEMKQFNIVVVKDGKSYDISNEHCSISVDGGDALKLTKVGYGWEIYCKKNTRINQKMFVEIPDFKIKKEFEIQCVSMMG